MQGQGDARSAESTPLRRQTPGTLVIKPAAYSNLILALDHKDQDQSAMSYRIDTLEFGLGNNTFDHIPIAHQSANIERYIQTLEGSNRNRLVVANYHDEQGKKDYMSHLKIIPVIVNNTDSPAQDDHQKYR